MQIIDLTDAGAAPYEILRKYGGSFSFFEKLKKGGTGSSKWIYQSGVPAFDVIREGRGTDTCYVNAELLKNGILFRLNKVQRLKGLIASANDIEKIILEAIPMNKHDYETSLSGGLLSIYFFNGTVLALEVPSTNIKATRSFFNKSPLPLSEHE